MERHLRSPEYCDIVGYNMTPKDHAGMHGYLLLEGQTKESSNRDINGTITEDHESLIP